MKDDDLILKIVDVDDTLQKNKPFTYDLKDKQNRWQIRLNCTEFCKSTFANVNCNRLETDLDIFQVFTTTTS